MKWPRIFEIMREEVGGDDGEGKGGGGSADKSKVTINGEEIDISRAASALSLYKALEDPDTASEIVETLARRAGLLDKSGEPELTEKQTKKAMEGLLTKTLKNKLGKDYDKFSDIMGPALEEALETMLTERFSEQESRSNTSSWENGVNKFMETHTLTSEIEDKMKELMEEAPPNPKSKTFNQQRYLARMYNSAVEDLDIEAPPVRQSRDRKGSDRDDIPDYVVRPAPKNLDLDSAIEAATKGIRFKR